jgi:hypothetical protein
VSVDAIAIEPHPRTMSVESRARLWPVLCVVVAFYALAVGLRLAQHDILWFVHFEEAFLEQSAAPATPDLDAATRLHYDGQYYWAMAVDPRGASEYIPESVVAHYYSRPVYPAAAGVLSLGSDEFVPYMLLAINLAAILGGTVAIATWLRRRGVAPWWALVYGLYPGLVFAVFHDLTEPLAYGLVAAAALAFDRRTARGLWGAAVLLALAALTRETTAIFAFVAALAVLLGSADPPELSAARRWKHALLFLLATIGPLLAWRTIVAGLLDTPAEQLDGLTSFVPFHGIADWWPWEDEHYLELGAVVLPTAVCLAGIPFLLRAKDGWLAAVLLGLNAAALVVFLPTLVAIDYRGGGRVATGVMLAALFCLPIWMRQAPRMYARLAPGSWSLIWFFAVAILVGVPGYSLITS